MCSTGTVGPVFCWIWLPGHELSKPWKDSSNWDVSNTGEGHDTFLIFVAPFCPTHVSLSNDSPLPEVPWGMTSMSMSMCQGFLSASNVPHESPIPEQIRSWLSLFKVCPFSWMIGWIALSLTMSSKQPFFLQNMNIQENTLEGACAMKLGQTMLAAKTKESHQAKHKAICIVYIYIRCM